MATTKAINVWDLSADVLVKICGWRWWAFTGEHTCSPAAAPGSIFYAEERCRREIRTRWLMEPGWPEVNKRWTEEVLERHSVAPATGDEPIESMSSRWAPWPCVAGDVGLAMQLVVPAMIERGYLLVLNGPPAPKGNYSARFINPELPKASRRNGSTNPARAICRSALATIEAAERLSKPEGGV